MHCVRCANGRIAGKRNNKVCASRRCSTKEYLLPTIFPLCIQHLLPLDKVWCLYAIQMSVHIKAESYASTNEYILYLCISVASSFSSFSVYSSYKVQDMPKKVQIDNDLYRCHEKHCMFRSVVKFLSSLVAPSESTHTF